MEPWDFDYQLDFAAIERLARVCDLCGPVESLGAGWDYATFVCDGQVLRIPKRAKTAALLKDELELLLEIPNDLPLAIPRPRNELLAAAGLPYAAMVYPLIAGTPLDQFDGHVDANVLARQVGGFFKQLHRLKPAIPGVFDFGEWTHHLTGKIKDLRPFIGPSTEKSLRAALLRQPQQQPSRCVLCHMDLGDEHILVDAFGKPVALIDWGDADIAPWWSDFTGLFLWGGASTLAAALDAYGHELRADERRALLYHGLLAITNELYFEVRLDPTSADAANKLHRFNEILNAV